MQKIFISYRRDDSRHSAGRISDRLVAHFGKDHVFMDIERIPLGIDFRQYVKQQLEHCEVVLAIIGDDWLIDGEKPSGNTHIELATALARGDIPVIPVLVGDAPIPSEDQLPDDLKELSYRNGIKLHADQGFDAGMRTLIEAIEHETNLGPSGPAAVSKESSRSADGAPRKKTRAKKYMFGIGAVILLLIGLYSVRYYINDYLFLEYTLLDISSGPTETIRIASGSSRVFGFTVEAPGEYEIAVISTPEHVDQGWSLFAGDSEEPLEECDTDVPERGTETCQVQLEVGQIYELEVENLTGDEEDEPSEPVYFTITVSKL